ncbi:MAG: STAS domain-containing protein [Chitinispirillales bacterium]|jgi:anti-anti-sigma factor|nr:STAS domain-containing protein [Chitinispirillales bacterium]
MSSASENTYTFKMPQRFNAETPYKTVIMLKELPASDCECVVLDLSDTVSMDSAGIGVLVFLYKELTARSKSLVLKKPQRGIYNLLMETGIDRLFDVELSSGVKKADAGLNELDAQLNIEEEVVGDVYVVSLFGVMNYPTGSQLFKKSMFLTLSSTNKILLNCQELAFFDSLSVGSVLRLSRILQDNGGSMRICCANDVVRNVFASLGIDSIIQIFNTREDALDGW